MHPLQIYKTLRLGALLLVVLVDLACRGASETHVGGKSPGALILPSGTAITYTHHYDHNALAGAEVSGNTLVALTTTGHLLTFDVATLDLVRERVCIPGFTCNPGPTD